MGGGRCRRRRGGRRLGSGRAPGERIGRVRNPWLLVVVWFGDVRWCGVLKGEEREIRYVERSGEERMRKRQDEWLERCCCYY